MGKPCITSGIQRQSAQLQNSAALGNTLGCAFICIVTPGHLATMAHESHVPVGAYNADARMQAGQLQ
jgi:hypothetical protein